MRVTIVLETGAFFPKDDPNQTYFDIGYFETPSQSDIEVFEDGNPAQPPHVKKIGTGNVSPGVLANYTMATPLRADVACVDATGAEIDCPSQ